MRIRRSFRILILVSALTEEDGRSEERGGEEMGHGRCTEVKNEANNLCCNSTERPEEDSGRF